MESTGIKKNNCFRRKPSVLCAVDPTSSNATSCRSRERDGHSVKTSQSSHKYSSEGRRPPKNVYVKRDYRVGTYVKFRVRFPKRLKDKINEDAFLYTVKTLNQYYAEADRTDCRNCCLGCLAWFTSYLIYFCIDTHYEKCIRKAVDFINEQNEKVYIPRRLLLTDPIENGLRFLKVTILDHQKPEVLKTIISSSESSAFFVT